MLADPVPPDSARAEPEDHPLGTLRQVIGETSAHPMLERHLRRLQRSGLWGLTILEVLVQLAETKLREIDAEERRVGLPS